VIQALLEEMPQFTWQDKNGGTCLALRNQFCSRELRDENVRTYRSVQDGRDLLERLKFLATRGVMA
jgi:hypothetical protein